MEDENIANENTEHIEQMLRDAEAAPEPGSGEKIVHKGDDDLPAPMVVGTLESAGWAYIYDTKTGERSVANKNMLRQLLRRKRADGSYVFTTIKPPFSPKVGTLKCILHTDSPNRKHYDEIGLPVCRKSNLTSLYMVKKHMEKRHPTAWATIEQERKDKEREEDRAAQRAIADAVLKSKE